MSSNLLGVIRCDHYTGPITAKDYEAILHNQLLMIMPSYILPNHSVCVFLINTKMTSNCFHNHFNCQILMSLNIYWNEADFCLIHHLNSLALLHEEWGIISPQRVQDLFGSNNTLELVLYLFFRFCFQFFVC